MRLNTLLIPAKQIKENVFIYNPKTKTFFYVDFVEVLENSVELIFEIDLTSDGLEEKKITVHKDQPLLVLSDYCISANKLTEDGDVIIPFEKFSHEEIYEMVSFDDPDY